jgi:hypothetical protein
MIVSNKVVEVSSTGWTDGPLVGTGSIWWSVESRQRAAGCTGLSTRWTDSQRESSSGSSDGYKEAKSKILARNPLAPMNRQCISQCVGWFVSMIEWGGRQLLVAPDEPTPGKSIASDHLMVLLSAPLAQRLVCCLGLFIPLPPCHLRLLNCVEVQRSARHIQDHIQSIQVLNRSSLDYYMLCVCA